MLKPLDIEYDDNKGEELICGICDSRATHVIESSQTPLCDSCATAFEWGIANAEEKASKENNGKYAMTSWIAEDVLKLSPHMTKEDAEEHLSYIEDSLQEAMIERGWEFMEYSLPDDSEVIACEMTSVWDGGTSITTKAEYDPIGREVVSPETVDVEGLNICERTYITFPNGIEMDVDGEDVLVESRKER